MKWNARLGTLGVAVLVACMSVLAVIGADVQPRPPVPAPDFPIDDQPTILDLNADDEKATAPSRGLTNKAGAKVRVHIKSATSGKFVQLTNGASVGQVATVTNNQVNGVKGGILDVPLLLVEGPQTVSIAWKPELAANETTATFEARHRTSNAITITLDTTGPKLIGVELIDIPNAGSTLLVKFKDGDFAAVGKENFVVNRQAADGAFTETIAYHSEPAVDGNTVKLFLGRLTAGLYQLTVRKQLTDALGNFAGGSGDTSKSGKDQTAVFAAAGDDQPRGLHVQFPPFAPPKAQTIPEEGFNPDDFVETRVARLYYYRDGHRVAQIINRNIRSYNQAAVTQAERRAEDARDDANEKTDERRKIEREAVRAAQEARLAEQKLAAAREVLAMTQGLQNAIDSDNQTKAEIDRRLATMGPVPMNGNDPNAAERQALLRELEMLQHGVAANQADLKKLGDVSNLQTTVNNMEQSVASLRQTELQSQEKANQAEAAESRAHERQFRQEVAAASTNPDTYVPGQIDSVDPVTQVSISVIGEGLIQLRGPIKGINKIRTMINQIDSPVGQIKVGIFSVQVNGEKGDEMEKVVGDAEGYIDLSRFLVNQSLQLLRRSIQIEAALMAEQCDLQGHYQVDRDRRYLYSFFGRDFIDELYAMNSEFLFTENKLLSLHSMDTVSLNRALFILALSKNDVRERIVARFLESTKTDLPDAEFDFRRSSELKPHRTEKMLPPWNRTHLPVHNKTNKEVVIYEAVHRNAMQRYHFRNVRGFFDTGFTNPDTINPMQREFIRLAQIFKARLVAEMELKQRVIERGLIEDRSNDEEGRARILRSVHTEALGQLKDGYQQLLASYNELNSISESLQAVALAASAFHAQEFRLSQIVGKEGTKVRPQLANDPAFDASDKRELKDYLIWSLRTLKKNGEDIANGDWIASEERAELKAALANVDGVLAAFTAPGEFEIGQFTLALSAGDNVFNKLLAIQNKYGEQWKNASNAFQAFEASVKNEASIAIDLNVRYEQLKQLLEAVPLGQTPLAVDLLKRTEAAYNARKNSERAMAMIDSIQGFLNETRGPLDHRKLLNHLIDEQEDKFIELVEGTRSHIAVMDHYLKRLSIALEDDFKVQFYDPAFVGIREAARARQVNLGQVERTTILTNNRAFAKVDPQATIEFDLPKRQIAIKEAFDAAKALVEDTGALINDPTFLSAFQMMGGSKQPTTVKNLLPGQSTSTDQHNMGLVPPPQPPGTPGSALQSLVPEPAIYKLETGTGFQIRPVMQPDGDSVIYEFDYMYTTNIREPVRADEKHIGRIKRHFVHTEVQTSSFELREISRYQVALKLSRTSRGVPLLEDVPLVGAAFRPAPSAESSIQQNIILGQTTVYPTLFDLMGLRWAQHVVDLDHTSLLEAEHVVRGRQKTIRDFVFHESSRRVDEFLQIPQKTPDQYRPDFYHSQSLPSPHHPGGYSYPYGPKDPTGNEYERADRRPADMQEPPYDLHRHQPLYPERIAPGMIPESIPPQSPPEPIDGFEMRLDPASLKSSNSAARPKTAYIRPAYESQWTHKGAQYQKRIEQFPAVVPASYEELPVYSEREKIRRLPPIHSEP